MYSMNPGSGSSEGTSMRSMKAHSSGDLEGRTFLKRKRDIQTEKRERFDSPCRWISHKWGFRSRGSLQKSFMADFLSSGDPGNKGRGRDKPKLFSNILFTTRNFFRKGQSKAQNAGVLDGLTLDLVML